MKSLFITGGTRGIGRAVTLSQAAAGRTLFVNYLRDEEAAESLEKEASKKGAKVHLVQGNVGDPDSIAEMFKEIRKHTQKLDAIVHAAALGVFKPVTELRVKDWDLSLDVNAKALMVIAQQAKGMMKGGRIVAISSLGSRQYTPSYGAIGISKAALENLVRYLAVELAPQGVRVNAVSGGLIDTDSLKFFPDIERMKMEFLRRTPAGRIGKPEDLAAVVDFLLSDASDFICGQTIVADGGYSLL